MSKRSWAGVTANSIVYVVSKWTAANQAVIWYRSIEKPRQRHRTFTKKRNIYMCCFGLPDGLVQVYIGKAASPRTQFSTMQKLQCLSRGTHECSAMTSNSLGQAREHWMPSFAFQRLVKLPIAGTLRPNWAKYESGNGRIPSGEVVVPASSCSQMAASRAM